MAPGTFRPRRPRGPNFRAVHRRRQAVHTGGPSSAAAIGLDRPSQCPCGRGGSPAGPHARSLPSGAR
eukprot:5463477-Lingulodinium_polyedra.AAC.1